MFVNSGEDLRKILSRKCGKLGIGSG